MLSVAPAIWPVLPGRRYAGVLNLLACWCPTVKCTSLQVLPLLFGGAAFFCGCSEPDSPSLSKSAERPARLAAGQAEPARSESSVVGAISAPITRDQARFARLVKDDDPAIVYKDEERSGADRVMSPRLRRKLRLLARRVGDEWPNVRLRVTEAWDEQGEHGKNSLHYEGRAADLTTSDRDQNKLGRLAGLAVAVGLDWVYFENGSHVHVSVRR